MPDGGICTLTEKSLGRGGEVMIPQEEDIQAILKLSTMDLTDWIYSDKEEVPILTVCS